MVKIFNADTGPTDRTITLTDDGQLIASHKDLQGWVDNWTQLTGDPNKAFNHFRSWNNGHGAYAMEIDPSRPDQPLESRPAGEPGAPATITTWSRIGRLARRIWEGDGS
jgi:hypothetical protein